MNIINKIAIIGLGYVGFPLAKSFSKFYLTVGYDIDVDLVDSLNKKKHKNLIISHDSDFIKDANVFIITVPTPITKKNLPDLSYLKSASETVAKYIKKNDVVIYESTVYPGVTEDICVPILESSSKLRYNKDFFCGYSPERISPGDKSKCLEKIIKITSGSNSKTANFVDDLYRKIVKAGTYKVNSIKIAEAAKVIENTQRDLNIALFNEVLILSQKLNLNFNEIIKLAATKWNFIKFQPGLVGGHCLPVDPYYLSYIAKKNKFRTNTLLSGRSTNNYMKNYVISEILKCIKKNKLNNKVKILILGISYKYGVSDLRNSLGLKIFSNLKKKYKNTYYYDPFVNIKNKLTNIKKLKNFKLIIFLSSGKKYKPMFTKAVKNNLLILDPFNYFINM